MKLMIHDGRHGPWVIPLEALGEMRDPLPRLLARRSRIEAEFPSNPPSARLTLNRSGKDDFKFFFDGRFFLGSGI